MSLPPTLFHIFRTGAYLRRHGDIEAALRVTLDATAAGEEWYSGGPTEVLISDRNAKVEYSKHSVGVFIPAINWSATNCQRPQRRVLISDQTRRHSRRPC